MRFTWKSSSLVAVVVFVASCSRDLAIPPPPPTPQEAQLAGALDTAGHVPAADNEVRLVNAVSGERAWQRTDGDGGFLFGGLRAGSYLVQADVPGFAPLREGPFLLVAGQLTDAGVLPMVWLAATPQEGFLAGKVVVAGGSTGSSDGGLGDGGLDADGGLGGRPSDAMGATVTFSLERGAAPAVKIAETPVDAFGGYSARLPPGSYTLEVTHPYYLSDKRTGVTLGEGQRLDLSSQPMVLGLNPATVTGAVLLEVESIAAGVSTRPGAGVRVTSDTGFSALTDVTGAFSLGGLAAGTRRLSFDLGGYHDGAAVHQVTLAAGETQALAPVKLLLNRGDVAGRVRMSDGSQLDGVTVFVAGAADAGVGGYSTPVARSATDDTVGEFVLRGLPVAFYNVVAHRTNYVDAQSATFEVKVGEVTRLGSELRLARLQGDFDIEDADPTNTPHFTRTQDVTLVLSNVTAAAEYRVAEGSPQALQSAAYQPFATSRIAYQLSAGEGTKTVYLQIKNTSGNEGAPLSSTITLDQTPPANTAVVLASGSGFTRIASALPVTLNATDTGGVRTVVLAAPDADGGVPTLDGGQPLADGGLPAGGAALLVGEARDFVRDTSFNRPTSADGVQDVLAQFIDNAGNASGIVRASVVVDTQGPTSSSLDIVRGARATVDGYTNSLMVELLEGWSPEPNGGYVLVKLANDAADLAASPAQPVRARASWFLDPQGEGLKKVHFLFLDAAGNPGATGFATITYDATPPQVTATLLSPTPTSDAGVVLGLSTVETAPYSPDGGLALSESALFTNAVSQPYPSNGQVGFQLSPGDGPKTVYVRVRDAAGNDGTASVATELDTTAPSGLGLALSGALADGTSSSTLTASSTVTVNLSHVGATRLLLGDGAVMSCPPLDATWRVITGNSVANHPLPGSGPRRTVTACFADGAGNVAGPVSAAIDYDGAAPTGCQLQLTGLRANGQPTGNAKTAARSVPFGFTACTETPLEVALTEQASVNCAANAQGLTWSPLGAVANELTLSSVDATKTVRGCVRDAARNTAAFTQASLTLDTTPPTNGRVQLNGGAAYINAAQADGGVAVASVQGTAVGAAEWAVAEEGTTPSAFVDYAAQNPQSLALSAGDGLKTVRALFRDEVGNTTAAEVSDTIEVDTVAPTLTSLTLVGALADGTTSTTTTTATQVTANLVQTGATTVYFGTDTLTACPAAGYVPLVGNSARVDLSGSGTTRTVKACVGDAAGNVSALATATIAFDATGPSGCALVLTGLRADSQATTTSSKTGRRDVQYTLTSCTETPVEIVLTESAVGCAANASLNWTLYNAAATNTFTLGGLDGDKTVRGCARDAARNTQAITAAIITLDLTPPSAASVLIDNGNAWVNLQQKTARGGTNQVSVKATVTDATEWALAENATPSSFVSLATNPATFTFSAGDGKKTVHALFRDDVGNTTLSDTADDIEFDTVPPTLTSVNLTGSLADGTASDVTTASTAVLATLVQTGATAVATGGAAMASCSGQSWASYSGGAVQATLTDPGSPRTLAVCVADQAGNTAGPVTDTIAVDLAGPTGCALAMTGRRADGSTTALRKTALRDLGFTLSGCVEAPTEIFLTESNAVTCAANANFDWRPLTGNDTLTLSAVDGTKTVRGCVRDAAHNVGPVTADSIVLDTTPPTAVAVSVRGGAPYFNAADFAANTPASNATPVTGTASGAVEWALAEGAAPSAFSAFTSPATVTFPLSAGEGPRTVRALFRDDVGNVSAEAQDSIEVDLTAPTLAAVSLSGTLADGLPSTTNTTTTTVAATFSHAGATQAQLVDGAVTSCPATGYTPLNGVTLSLSLPGTGAVRTVKACVADAAGNPAGPILAGTMTVDTVAPTGCALVLAGKTVAGVTTSGATVNKTARADVGISLSGCSEAPTEVALTEAASVTCTTNAPLDWQPLAIAAFTLSSVDATKTVRGCVRDAAHNVASFVADDITLDTTPPSAASVSLKGDAGYFNRADFTTAGSSNVIAVTGTASGAAEWALAEGATPSSFTAFSSPTTSNFTFSVGDGTKTVRALFRDDVGNVTPLEAVDGIEVDTTPPTLTGLTLVGTLADGSSSTLTTAVTTVTASLVHTGGVQAFFGDATLAACPPGGYGPFSGNLASLVLPGSGVTRTVKACVMDVAGNTAGIATDTIDIDQSAPSGCALTLVGRRADGAATTGATADKTAQRDVTVAVTGCADAVDVALTEAATINCGANNLAWQTLVGGSASWTLSAVDAAKTVRGCVRDSTLNTSIATPDGITLDTTPPTATAVVIKGGAASFNRADFTAAGSSNAMPVTGTATGASEWALAEGVTPTSFVAFASPTTSTFTFSAGEGPRTVRALFRDDVGNVSVVEATDAIDVDLTPPTLTSLQLTGTLADGLPSTTLTVTTAVTATLDQAGGTTVIFGDATMAACPAAGYSTLSGATLPITLGGTGTTRTVKVCVADAAGNTAGPATDTLDVDSAAPSGCALVLVGRKVSGAATSGATANKTAQKDVTATLTGCTETPAEIFLTEATGVTCSAASPLAWLPFGGTGAPFTLSSVDATKTVRGCVRDAAHNVVSFTSDDIDLDTTPPTGAVVAIKGGAAWFNRADFNANVPASNTMTVTGTATGASEWALAEGAAPSSFVSFSSPATTPFPFSAGDGSKTVRVLLRDDVGNVTTEVTDSIDVDTAAPTLSALLLTGTLSDGTPSTTSTATATVTAALTQTGGTQVYFGDGTLAACPAAGYAAFDGLSATTTLTGAGLTRTVKACVADAAGNTAGPATDTIDLDAAAPTGCQLVLVGRRTDGAATTGGVAEYTALRDVGVTLTSCNETVTEVYVTESASVSCTASNTYTWLPLDAATQTTLSTVDGLKTVRGCVRDAAHNTLSFTADTITLDTTPPTAATVSIKGGAAWFNVSDFNANTPHSNAMPVSGSASGATEWALAESATPSTFTAWPATSPSQLTFSAPEGTKTVLALFRDALGNTTATEVTDTIDVDLTPPTLTSVALTGTLADGTPSDSLTVTTQVQLGIVHSGGTGLYVGDGTLAACPAAGYASFAGAAATITLPGTGAIRTVRACISDAAGNVAGYQQDSLAIDSVSPTGCALTLVGRKVNGTATSGATVDRTAQALVGVALGSCSETPTEVFLTEAGAVTCTPTATLTWQAFTAGATNFALTGGDATKAVLGCVRDAAHNVSTLVGDSITLDTTPPSGAAVALHGGAAWFNRANYNANVPASNRMNVTGTATGAAEWAYAEGAAPSSWVTFSSPATVPFDVSAGDGTKTLRALFRDDVGNTTTAEATDSIDVDTQAPTLTSLTVTGALADGTASTTSTSTTAATVSLTQSGGTLVAVGDSTFTCPATVAGFTAFNGSTTTATLTDPGTPRTVKACVADAAGNASGTVSGSIGFDATPPAGCVLTLVGRRTDGSSTAGTVPEKTALATVAASLSGCAEAPTDLYLVETGGALACPAAGSALWQTLSGGTSLATTLSAGDGLKTVKACVRDATRNVSAAAFADTITLDTTPPTGATVSLHGSAPYFNLAAYNLSSANRMNVTGTATGATEWAWAESAAPTTFGAFASPVTVANTFSSGDGTKTVRALFRDDVGNTTPSESVDTIEVDTVSPSLSSLTLVGTLGDGTSSTVTTNIAAVTANLVQSGGTALAYGDATFVCPASVASFTSFSGSSAPVTLPGAGTPRTVKACLTDAAGNTSATVSDTIDYDAATPSGCALVLTGHKVDGTVTSGPLVDATALRDVGVSLSGCADTNVQVALTEAVSVTCSNAVALTWVPLVATTTFQLSSGDATKTVRGCVRDAALNVGSLTFDTIDLDTTPPDSPLVTLGSGAYSTSSTVTASGQADSATEWATATTAAGPFTFGAYSSTPSTRSVTFGAPDGTKTVYAKFRDALQNTTAAVSDTIIVDTTPPTAPVLLTVDGQNRAARLFWDPSSDTNGIASYQLLCGATAPPTVVCATASGTATDGAVLSLANKADQVFAVRAVDNAGNPSATSGSLSTTVGWRHATMNPGSVQQVRPLDVAVRGADVYVTYMEIDYNWAGLGGTLKIAVSHDRGLTWAFKTLDASYGAGRTVAPIGFTSSAVWVASAANYGFPSDDLQAGQVSVYSSVDRGDSWANVSNGSLGSQANYAKSDGLGLVTSGDSMRLWYMLASGTSTRHINLVYADNTAASTSLQSTYDVSNVWGYAPYQVTGGLRSCGGNFTSLTMWRDRNSTGIETNLRALTHFYLPDTTFDQSANEGFLSSVSFGSGAGQEAGAFDLACVSLPETMQAYVVYNRAPAAAWAVGSSNTLMRWDDTSWTTVQSPADPSTTLYSAQDVWAVGAWYYAGGTYYDTILRWNGTIWERLPSMTVAGGNSLYDIWGSSSTNVYAVGAGGHIIRWDGSAWSAQTSNTTTSLNGIWGSASNNIYAVGTSGFITKYNGVSWAAQTSNTVTTLNGIWGSASNNIYAVGSSGVIMRFNGTAWGAVASPTAQTLTSIWGTSGSDIWAVGYSGTILHCTGAIPCTWAVVSSPTVSTLNEVSGTATNEAWAVGSSGTALKWDGVSWTAVTTNTTATLYSVWGGSAGGGSANALYARRKLSTLGSFTVATQLRSDADPVQAPHVWAGGRNVYVLYRDTSNRLMLGESTDEATSFPQWTTLESGANKGLFGVLSGENSSDVAAAWTDVNAATFSVLLPAVGSTQLTVTPGVGTSSLAWNAIPGVDRYQVDTDPDGAEPWASSDFTSLTQGTVPTPGGLAPYTQVRGVDARGMPGNTGELWQVRPFTDTTLTTFSYTPYASNTGGVVAYNDKVFVWPPQSSIGGSEMTIYRSSDYGQSWSAYSPATTYASYQVRAMAGVNGRVAMFFEDSASLNSLKAWVYPDLMSTAPTLMTLHAATVGVDLIAAKASIANDGVVVAYADVPNDTIRVQYSNSTLTSFYLRNNITTTAANTIGALEVAKADLSTGRIVIAWREYTAGDPRTDLLRVATSTDWGWSWSTATTLTSGSFSYNSASATYWLGDTQLAGANNGGYSVLTHVSAANNFWNKNANLQLTVTGSDHSTAVSSATYATFTLDAETVDNKTVDAFANSDGHYLTYRTESFDGSMAKLKLAFCVSDCHLASKWVKSQLKSWTSQVPNQGRVVSMTVGQTSSAAYDPALYVLYQEAGANGYRSLKVLSHGVHRRTK